MVGIFGLSLESQRRIEDLPFKDIGFFSDKTDKIFEKNKTSHYTVLRTYSILILFLSNVLLLKPISLPGTTGDAKPQRW